MLDLFTESLVRGGFICLGPNEDILFSDVRHRYRRLDDAARIFQLHAGENPAVA